MVVVVVAPAIGRGARPSCACHEDCQQHVHYAQALTEAELVQVLTEPRNALHKQFAYQFEVMLWILPLLQL